MTATPDAVEGLSELATLVQDCMASGVERRVLLLRTDLLPPRLARKHHLRLATEALEPLAAADRARRYELPLGRLGISWRGDAADRLNRVLDALGHLVAGSPLDAPPLPELVRLFDLPREGEAVLAVATLPGPARRPGPQEIFADDEIAARPPLDLRLVGAMEEQLAVGNIARFVRRHLVCRVTEGLFLPAWESRFLAVRDLGQEMCPDRDPLAALWLLRRLTRTFDRRMLALLSSWAELKDAGPFGLELNLAGLLSPDFLRFDAALPSRLRGHVVINLHVADVMGDPGSFRFACAFARSRGYLILLRGVTAALLGVVKFAALRLDYIELKWSPDAANADPGLLRAGTARWVLARADHAAAVAWGRGVGIGLFQGEAVQPGAGLAGMLSAA